MTISKIIGITIPAAAFAVGLLMIIYYLEALNTAHPELDRAKEDWNKATLELIDSCQKGKTDKGACYYMLNNFLQSCKDPEQRVPVCDDPRISDIIKEFEKP
ncbi:MAG: hypothetical protein HY295_00715 [Thaumarchaeota archaeon]|nr:hypothetical protein [Nitrososphaerota archaeon]